MTHDTLWYNKKGGIALGMLLISILYLVVHAWLIGYPVLSFLSAIIALRWVLWGIQPVGWTLTVLCIYVLLSAIVHGYELYKCFRATFN